MLSRLSRRLSYANVMSTIAVVVAVGTGSAYAANTIRSTDIVDGEVKTADVANQNLTGGDVKDGSITTYDLADGYGVAGADIVDSNVTGADIADSSLSGVDIAGGTIKRDDLADDVITSGEVVDHSLTDDDVGENAFVNFAADIGVVPANSCVIKDITGTAAAGDHILLTTSSADGLSAISYDAIEEPSSDGRFAIKACNPATVPINDGTTHFNALVFAR